jgi:hypothetical protein
MVDIFNISNKKAFMFLYLKLCLQMSFLLLACYAFGFKTQKFGKIIL